MKDLNRLDIFTSKNTDISLNLLNLDLTQDKSYLIRKATFKNGESISMIARGRIITENNNPIDHNSISIRHPRIDFILNINEKNIEKKPTKDELLLRIEGSATGSNSCFGFSDRCTRGYIANLGYMIEKDPLESDEITFGIKRDVKKIFEIVYLNSKK